MHCVLGHSDEPDAADAAAELLGQCRSELDGEEPRAALLFASADYAHEAVLRAVQAQWPGLPLIGGSSDGEFSSRLGFRHDSVLLVVLAGDDVGARSGLGRDLSAGVAAAVAAATEGVRPDRAQLCLGLFAPSSNGSEVVREVNRRFGGQTPLFGGLSGDHWGRTGMREFHGDQVLRDSLPLLFLDGELRVGWGLGSGWFPIGEEHRVTRSEGHIVHAIDGQPATAIFQQHYGSLPSESLGEYPLAVRAETAGEEDWALRAPMMADLEGGWLRFAGEVPQGSRVRLTEVLPDGILSGSTRSLSQALASYPGSEPEIALVFSCAARKWVLGTKAEQELDHLRRAAAEHGLPDLPIAGLYVYGEIAPFPGQRSSAFHNETCVSVVLGR